MLVSRRRLNVSNFRYKMWLMYQYSTARSKIGGYTLRITGDIDRTTLYLRDRWHILEKWIRYADKISIASPVVFVLPNPPNDFLELRDKINEISDRMIVGAHGFCYRHIHFNGISTNSMISLIDELKSKVKPLPKIFRFPYLDANPRILKLISKHFSTDSNVAVSFFKPFELFGMMEYPITPPTDGYFSISGTSPLLASRAWKRIIETSKQRNIQCTLLIHPNEYTVKCFEVWGNA